MGSIQAVSETRKQSELRKKYILLLPITVQMVTRHCKRPAPNCRKTVRGRAALRRAATTKRRLRMGPQEFASSNKLRQVCAGFLAQGEQSHAQLDRSLLSAPSQAQPDRSLL